VKGTYLFALGIIVRVNRFGLSGLGDLPQGVLQLVETGLALRGVALLDRRTELNNKK
jgi:hypothetical protein